MVDALSLNSLSAPLLDDDTMPIALKSPATKASMKKGKQSVTIKNVKSNTCLTVINIVIIIACFVLSLTQIIAVIILINEFDAEIASQPDGVKQFIVFVGVVNFLFFGVLILRSFYIQRRHIAKYVGHEGDGFTINLFLTFSAAVYFFALAYQYHLEGKALDMLSYVLLGFGVIVCGITLIGDVNLTQIYKNDGENKYANFRIYSANFWCIISGIILIALVLIFTIV